MARPAVFTYPAADRDGICLAQQSNGSALVMNGALLDLAATTYGAQQVVLPGIQRVVTVYSAADLSSVNFTITGYDLRGNAISETIAGPDTSPTTVSTTAEYHVITGIDPNAAVGSDVEIGTGEAGATNWFIVDYFANPFNVGWVMDVTGTVDVDLKYTASDVQNDSSPIAFDIDDNITTDVAGNFTTPCRAIQADVQAGTTGSFILTIIQSG